MWFSFLSKNRLLRDIPIKKFLKKSNGVSGAFVKKMSNLSKTKASIIIQKILAKRI